MPGRSSNTSNSNDNYKFTGHERDNEAGLNLIHMGARGYDPVIARMLQVDPFHAKAPGWTPYRYAFNNPMRYLDPDGLYETDGHFWTVYLAARLTGRSDAYLLAFAAELPDHIMNAAGDIVSSTATWANPFMQGPYHGLTGFSANYERMHSRRLFANGLDTYQRGAALHRLGDSYSHTKKSGSTYSPPFGHWVPFNSTKTHWPDKIANRPELYLQYVKDLISTLGGVNIDLFTFEYIANEGGTTEENSAILETEIRLMGEGGSYSVSGRHSSAIKKYINARNRHYGTSYKTATATRYTINENGEWEESTVIHVKRD